MRTSRGDGDASGYYKDSNGDWHRSDGKFASNTEVGLPAPTPKVSDGTHRNSLSSTEPNHVYVIVDGNGNMLKVGISGQPLNVNGTSPRANPQVSNFNNNSGMNTYAIIVENNLTRTQALALEQKITDKHAARNNGLMPSQYHQKPYPQVESIVEYENLYNEPHNSSNGGRY